MNAIGYAILVFVVNNFAGVYLGFLVSIKTKMSNAEIKKWANTVAPITFYISALLALATLFIMWGK